MNAFLELAATAGAVFNLHERWALMPQVRVPIWFGTAGRTYSGAAGLTLRGVFGAGREAGDEDGHGDEGDEGGEGEAHGHGESHP